MNGEDGMYIIVGKWLEKGRKLFKSFQNVRTERP